MDKKYYLLYEFIKRGNIKNEIEKTSIKQVLNLIFESITNPETHKYSPVICGKILLILYLIKKTNLF